MAHLYYSYFAYILPESNADIITLKSNLEALYDKPVITDKPKISLNENQIKITFDDGYNFYVHLADEEYINIEAREFADLNPEDWNGNIIAPERIKAAHKRFEIWGDPDFDMDYFNDSLFIIEQIEEFSSVIILQNE